MDQTANTNQQGQGQLCTPEQMAAMQGQLCTPQQMAAMQGQLCTPQQMAAQQQLCLPQQQLCLPQQGQGQLCLPQQGQLCTPGQEMISIPVSMLAPYLPYLQGMLMGPMGVAPGAGPDIYQIDKPVEKPNVMQMNEPHVGKPTLSAKDALTNVFSLIFPQGYGPDDNLFEKGLDSFKVMQIVTRCGENGYRVKMQDIFRNPTFNGIVEHMEAGE